VRFAAVALLFAASLAAGCVTRTTATPVPAGTGDESIEAEGLVLECDRARVVLPRGAAVPAAGDREVRWEGTTIRTREAPVAIEAAGEDFSVVAEGGVLLRRREGGRTVEEGPYRTVVLRGGRLLRR
jgi:hypothetical protein